MLLKGYEKMTVIQPQISLGCCEIMIIIRHRYVFSDTEGVSGECVISFRSDVSRDKQDSERSYDVMHLLHLFDNRTLPRLPGA